MAPKRQEKHTPKLSRSNHNVTVTIVPNYNGSSNEPTSKLAPND